MAEYLRGMLLATGLPSMKKSSSFLTCPTSIASFHVIKINGNNHACTLFQNALLANPQLACLMGMDAGIFMTGLRFVGVPIGNDEWVQ